MKTTLKQILEDTRIDLKNRITQSYFIHLKPDERPDFITADEANEWYEKQNFIAEKIVGSWVDNTMVVVEQSIKDALEAVRVPELELDGDQELFSKYRDIKEGFDANTTQYDENVRKFIS